MMMMMMMMIMNCLRRSVVQLQSRKLFIYVCVCLMCMLFESHIRQSTPAGCLSFSGSYRNSFLLFQLVLVKLYYNDDKLHIWRSVSVLFNMMSSVLVSVFQHVLQ